MAGCIFRLDLSIFRENVYSISRLSYTKSICVSIKTKPTSNRRQLEIYVVDKTTDFLVACKYF
ncbi:hypothetical protein ETTORE_0208 [Pseudomonas phage Ettore]|nr:hypothetical protein Deiofobo_0207 [Pseudomonas phage Deifobo]WPK39917.1 hypothetical protein ETTORE_0208 [Pseudomonas phage Ettore]